MMGDDGLHPILKAFVGLRFEPCAQGARSSRFFHRPRKAMSLTVANRTESLITKKRG
jgi:hypothetical protein